MAQDSGMPSAVVLTGETKAGDLDEQSEEHLPDYVLGRIDHLILADLREELGWRDA